MKGLEGITNQFWKEVICTYIDSKATLTQTEINSSNFRSQLIFNNSLITYKSGILFFQTWIDKGIEQLKQIIHPTENRLLTPNEIHNMFGIKLM